MSDFRDRYPSIEIGVAQYPYDRLQTMLLRGDLDVALATHPNGIAPPLVGEALYAERFAVACPHGHRLANRHSIHLADIDGETQLSATVGEPEDWVLSMVAAGMGVCVRSEFSLRVHDDGIGSPPNTAGNDFYPGRAATPLGGVTLDVSPVLPALASRFLRWGRPRTVPPHACRSFDPLS